MYATQPRPKPLGDISQHLLMGEVKLRDNVQYYCRFHGFLFFFTKNNLLIKIRNLKSIYWASWWLYPHIKSHDHENLHALENYPDVVPWEIEIQFHN